MDKKLGRMKKRYAQVGGREGITKIANYSLRLDQLKGTPYIVYITLTSRTNSQKGQCQKMDDYR